MSYNGWSNYKTWNVALWIGNDENLYRLASECRNYTEFIQSIECVLLSKTPDNISFTDVELNIQELNEFIEEL